MRGTVAPEKTGFSRLTGKNGGGVPGHAAKIKENLKPEKNTAKIKTIGTCQDYTLKL